MECRYEAWIDHPVILHLATEGIHVPLRGRLVGETAEVLRLRVEETFDFDILKSMVLAIEAVLPSAPYRRSETQ